VYYYCKHRTPSSAASEIGERQQADFTSPLQRLLCTDEIAQICKTAKKTDFQKTYAKQDKTNKLQQHSAKQ